MPPALGPALAATDFTAASLYATLRSADPAQLPWVADYPAEARPPEARERDLLEIEGGTPVLVAERLALNQDGRPLEVIEGTLEQRVRVRVPGGAHLLTGRSPAMGNGQ